MRFCWETPISYGGMWEPELDGVFIPQEQGVVFYFKKRDRICCCQDSRQERAAIHTAALVPNLPLPDKWSLVNFCGDDCLVLDMQRMLSLSSNCLLELPRNLHEQVAYRNEKMYESESFELGEFTVSQQGNCGYVCHKSGAEVWKFTGKGYLYTDIFRWNDRIFWGTAGRSGYFYVVAAQSGTPVVTMKTGGTRCFIQKGNVVYLLRNSEDNTHAELCCIELSSGKLGEAVSLRGKASVHSKIQLLGEVLHTVTFVSSKGSLSEAVWSCVAL